MLYSGARFLVVTYFRTSHHSCTMKKVVFKNFAIFTGKHLCLSIFLNKVAIRPVTLLKRDSNTIVFLWILRTKNKYFEEHLLWNATVIFLFFRTTKRGCFTLLSYLSALFVFVSYIFRFLFFHVLWIRSFGMKNESY